MAGKSSAEIAAQYDANQTTTHNNIGNMAGTMANKVPSEEIAAMIPDLSEAAPEDSRDPDNGSKETSELSKLQADWYTTFLANPEDTETITRLSPAQQQHLANRLAAYLRPFIIRREPSLKILLRVTQMSLLITGQPLAEIAEATGQTHQAVKSDLQSTAYILERRLKPREREKIISDAVAFTDGRETDG